jgi:hypothetical protein
MKTTTMSTINTLPSVAPHYYIALSIGYWGGGNTIDKALAQLKKSGGKMKGHKILVFYAERQFSSEPDYKETNTASVWIDESGHINTWRCRQAVS